MIAIILTIIICFVTSIIRMVQKEKKQNNDHGHCHCHCHCTHNACNERMSQRFQLVPSMVYEFEIDESQDNKATFPWTSNASKDIYGLSPEDMFDADNVIKLIHSDDMASFVESVNISHENMTKWKWMGRIRSKDGLLKTILCESNPQRINNHVVRWTGAIQDITELEQFKKRDEVHKILRNVYSVMSGTIAFEIEKSTQQLKWIEGDTLEFSGYSKEEWLMKHSLTRIIDKMESLLTNITEKESPMVEMKILHKDKQTSSWVRTDKTCRILLNGNMLIIMHEVTAEVALREEKQRRIIAEALAARFKAACAYLSHEIRNQLFPQSVVLGMMKNE